DWRVAAAGRRPGRAPARIGRRRQPSARMTVVKICGLRSLPEARLAVQAGAHLLGFIFWPDGKRYIPPPEAARIISALRSESPGWSAVGVFVDPSPLQVRQAVEAC